MEKPSTVVIYPTAEVDRPSLTEIPVSDTSPCNDIKGDGIIAADAGLEQGPLANQATENATPAEVSTTGSIVYDVTHVAREGRDVEIRARGRSDAIPN